VEKQIDTANYISGAGHVLLIGWIMIGNIFSSEPPPFEVTEVSVISGAEFSALMAAQTAPQAVPEPTQPEVPAPQPEPTQTEATEVETAPEVPAVEPLPDVPISDTAPVVPTPPEPQAVIAPDVSDKPVPRPVERVAPEPVAQPEPDARVSDSTQEAVQQQETGPTVQEPQEATAPEEATTEIVTEATEKPSAAPSTSPRPPAQRPSAPKPVAETPTAPAAPTSPPDVNAALAEAMSGSAEPAAPSAPSAPVGPPLSSGERDALRVAVSNCWNVLSLSSDALRTTVVVAVNLSEDGKPEEASIRMIGNSGGTDASAEQAFEAARRAIIRCGASGFNLPKEKYSQWREIEMTFDPAGMRLK
jgi:hypothetical protein